MVKGANAGLASLSEDISSVVLSLAWCSATGDGDADVSVLLLDANGKVRSDADFFFYNNPAAADGSVQLLGKTPTADGSEDRITLDLSAMPSGVERVVVAASRYGDARFGDLDDLRIAIADRTGEALLGFSITDAGVESAFIFGELYRRGEEWKFRAVGQGYETGLAGLATDFGIDMDDASEEEPEEPVGGAEPSAVVVEAPAESPVHVPAQTAAPDAAAARPRRPRTAKKKVTLPQTPRKSLAENDAWRGEPAMTEGPIDAVDSRRRRRCRPEGCRARAGRAEEVHQGAERGRHQVGQLVHQTQCSGHELLHREGRLAVLPGAVRGRTRGCHR